MVQCPAQSRFIPALQPGDQATFVLRRHTPRQQQAAERRRDGERHQQRSEDRGDVGDAERLEETAFQALEEQQRHEYQHDDDGGKDHRRTHFVAGVQHHA